MTDLLIVVIVSVNYWLRSWQKQLILLEWRVQHMKIGRVKLPLFQPLGKIDP